MFFSFSHRVVIKKIEFRGCKSEYLYSYDDFYKENQETGGHGSHNFMNEYDAKQEICKCLCDKYVKTNEVYVRNYILNHYYSNPFLSENYSHVVLWKLAQNAPIDSLMKYQNEIFINNEDNLIFNLLGDYLLKPDDSLKFEIINLYKNKNKSAVNNYFTIIKKQYLKDGYIEPNIDSLCKYKDFLFTSIYVEND